MKITKMARAVRGQEPKWEIRNERNNAMNCRTETAQIFLATLCAMLMAAPVIFAQEPGTATNAPGGRGSGGRGFGRGGPTVVSPEVLPDRRIIWRLQAPQAQSVRLTGADFTGGIRGGAMAKGTNGIWEMTLGPFDPGAYRYNFNVDGVDVTDPRNPTTSESNDHAWSMVPVPGSDLTDIRDVPHGAVAEVYYYSTALQRFRRMHVYTPPGYENGKGKFPVFYLLHGAQDTDAAWTSVGRAGFILDNLIAARKIKPMVVVMPAGHTTRSNARGAVPNEFEQDFLTDVLPYAERHYRVRANRANRAIAGLSMGGSQTLNIAIPHLDQFAYVGVFSSGLIGAFSGASSAGQGQTWEQRNLVALDNAKFKKGLKLLWFATGKQDSLLNTSRSTVDLLKKHGFTPVFKETDGAHTWTNWRNYLIEFAPQLFQ